MEPGRYQYGIMRCEDARFGFKLIKFCHGLTDDKPFYAFVAVEPQNFAYFENHYIEDCYSNFSVFGQEILRGWGRTPPSDIIDYIKLKHGIEFGVDKAYLLHLAQLTLQSAEKGQNPASPFLDANEQEYPEKPAEALGS